MGRVLIGVGSNSGHRSRLIKKALNLLQREMRIERVSSFVRSAPAEGVSGGYFLNGVVQAKTSLQPASVVKFLQSVEVSLGRPANHPRKQARCIDLDLLFYDGYTI
ncbi:MAG TPA: 2-amino-4-hydroxy-6-hydroxymethyldihydropteridine diphosphokinase, partial [bacterium]|nr:2-amino-4-hydroxy-6-hydroxymethyldihydropteridine diphosphokinase [bacterium]